MRILTTLALPDAGRARVAGIDVLARPAAVRRHIGVAAQDATLDGLLTGRRTLRVDQRLADATPIEASLAWSVLILVVAAPPASRSFRRRTTE